MEAAGETVTLDLLVRSLLTIGLSKAEIARSIGASPRVGLRERKLSCRNGSGSRHYVAVRAGRSKWCKGLCGRGPTRLQWHVRVGSRGRAEASRAGAAHGDCSGASSCGRRGRSLAGQRTASVRTPSCGIDRAIVGYM